MNEQQFNAGVAPDEYVDSMRNYRSFVRDLMGSPSINKVHAGQLKRAVESSSGPLRATIMTEDWCGDAACNLPAVAALMQSAGIELRIIRGSDDAELKTYYESDGDDHIPVISIWDGEFTELARWIEAPASIQVQKAAWKADRPNFMELYGKRDSDPEAAKEFAKLYREFMNEMISWYQTGGWDNTTAEIVSQVLPH
jgi:hypothetical protein